MAALNRQAQREVHLTAVWTENSRGAVSVSSQVSVFGVKRVECVVSKAKICTRTRNNKVFRQCRQYKLHLARANGTQLWLIHTITEHVTRLATSAVSINLARLQMLAERAEVPDRVRSLTRNAVLYREMCLDCE